MAVAPCVALTTAFPVNTTGFWKNAFAAFTLYPPPAIVMVGPAWNGFTVGSPPNPYCAFVVRIPSLIVTPPVTRVLFAVNVN